MTIWALFSCCLFYPSFLLIMIGLYLYLYKVSSQNYKNTTQIVINWNCPFSVQTPCIQEKIKFKKCRVESGVFDTATVALRPDTRAGALTGWLFHNGFFSSYRYYFSQLQPCEVSMASKQTIHINFTGELRMGKLKVTYNQHVSCLG